MSVNYNSMGCVLTAKSDFDLLDLDSLKTSHLCRHQKNKSYQTYHLQNDTERSIKTKSYQILEREDTIC